MDSKFNRKRKKDDRDFGSNIAIEVRYLNKLIIFFELMGFFKELIDLVLMMINFSLKNGIFIEIENNKK